VEIERKMMILLQLVLFCLYFDPKDYIEKAVELGIVDKIRKIQ
jgi:hypothetical protein